MKDFLFSMNRPVQLQNQLSNKSNGLNVLINVVFYFITILLQRIGSRIFTSLSELVPNPLVTKQTNRKPITEIGSWVYETK